jgi:predicted RND superfamily exporter protein
VLLLQPPPDLEPEELALILQKTEKLLEDLKLPYHLGGVWYMTAMLDSFSAQSTKTLFPVVLIILSLGVWYCIRDSNNVLLVLACGLLPAVQIVGIMAVAGVRLNMVLLALPPLTMILGTAYGIHLVAKVPDSSEQSPRELYAQVAQPCMFSGITTSLGFLSLTLSGYLPVRQLGFWGMAATLLALGNALMLLPLFFRPAPRQPFSISLNITLILYRFRYLLLCLFLLVFVTGAFGLARLSVGSLMLDFFEKDADVRQNYVTIENAGLGLTPFEIDLEGSLVENHTLRESLTAFARSHPVVSHIFYYFPAGQVVIQTTPAGLNLPSPFEFDLIATQPQRATVLLQTLASEETLELSETLNLYLEEQHGKLQHPYVTGSVPLYTRGQKALFSSMVQSFGFAFLSISLIIGLALRSLRYGILAIIPNFLPVFFILAIMGWLGIPLSVSTVTVASIVFGIVVDDTIHFLHRLRRQPAGKMTERLQDCLEHVGPAIIITTLVAGFGFLGFYVSPFIPLRDFGLIIAVALLLALLCDLFLFPVLLLIWKKEI